MSFGDFQYVPLVLRDVFDSHAAAICSICGDENEARRIAAAAAAAGEDLITMHAPPADEHQHAPIFRVHSSPEGVLLWAGDRQYATPSREEAEAFLQAVCPNARTAIMPMLAEVGGRDA